MKVLYIDTNGEPQEDSDCDGPGCEVHFPVGFMLLIGLTEYEGRDVPTCKLFCSMDCLGRWKEAQRS